MNTSTIKVTWTDGYSEVFSNVTTTVRDSVLHLHQYGGVCSVLMREWHIPLFSVRIWKPEEQ